MLIFVHITYVLLLVTDLFCVLNSNQWKPFLREVRLAFPLCLRRPNSAFPWTRLCEKCHGKLYMFTGLVGSPLSCTTTNCRVSHITPGTHSLLPILIKENLKTQVCSSFTNNFHRTQQENIDTSQVISGFWVLAPVVLLDWFRLISAANFLISVLIAYADCNWIIMTTMPRSYLSSRPIFFLFMRRSPAGRLIWHNRKRGPSKNTLFYVLKNNNVPAGLKMHSSDETRNKFIMFTLPSNRTSM